MKKNNFVLILSLALVLTRVVKALTVTMILRRRLTIKTSFKLKIIIRQEARKR